MCGAVIISVGNELLNGSTVDTNSAWLSSELLNIGVPTVMKFVIGDNIEKITKVISSACMMAEIVVITGGLGPTDDDLTRQAVARYLKVELIERPELLDKIQCFFHHRNLQMPAKNRIQACIPQGADALENEYGTAPGILAQKGKNIIAALPGPPVEMQNMFNRSVLPELKKLSKDKVFAVHKLHCFGKGESAVAEQLGDLLQRDRDPLINITVSGGVITLHVVAQGSDIKTAEDIAHKQAEQLKVILGDLVFGYGDDTLASVAGKLLRKAGKKISTAESCTGGLIAKLITDVPGSSEYFTCGWVCYSNSAKISQLGVAAELIERRGAVSQAVAIALAKGAREKSSSDIAVAVTGIAGPAGGTPQKPVGLVFIAIADRYNTDIYQFNFPSKSRDIIRLRTAQTALNLVRLKLSV